MSSTKTHPLASHRERICLESIEYNKFSGIVFTPCIVCIYTYNILIIKYAYMLDQSLLHSVCGGKDVM